MVSRKLLTFIMCLVVSSTRILSIGANFVFLFVMVGLGVSLWCLGMFALCPRMREALV
jgi:hypothetical protein